MDKLAGEIRFGLEESHPGMRKTILKKLPLAVSAMIQARMLNTMELSTRWPLDTERAMAAATADEPADQSCGSA